MSESSTRSALGAIHIIACGLLAAACGFAANRIHAANPDPARFDSEIAAFQKWDRQNAVPQDSILFVGSSSIRMWKTAESFPDLPVINRGFGGSHISDVNHFAEPIVIKYKPRTIVFYAGDNDIAAGKSPQQVADDFSEFVALVHDRLPETQILWLPIKPSIARWNLWPKMQEANQLVQELAQINNHLHYIDTAAPMLASDGEPRDDIFLSDGLHMNDTGYHLWNDVLRPRLK